MREQSLLQLWWFWPTQRPHFRTFCQITFLAFLNILFFTTHTLDLLVWVWLILPWVSRVRFSLTSISGLTSGSSIWSHSSSVGKGLSQWACKCGKSLDNILCCCFHIHLTQTNLFLWFLLSVEYLWLIIWCVKISLAVLFLIFLSLKKRLLKCHIYRLRVCTILGWLHHILW